MGAHGAPRLISFDYHGCRAYAVTCCTFERHPWFTNVTIVDRVRTQLLKDARRHLFDVSAYCFMSDHVHLLLEAIGATSDLRCLIGGWKQRTGYEHARATRRRLWQPGYYDHVLRHDEDRLETIAYIVGNPVRKGMVRDPAEYQFWGSSIWSRDELLEAIQQRARRDRGG
ncbi:MAG: transposase [Acidobacteria bacterium]|nr:transposase [Acidobacteriota bacterium]